MMLGDGKRRCTRRCEGLPGAFQPSALVADILVCRYCGETRREPIQPVASAAPARPSAPPLFTLGYAGLRLEQVLSLLESRHIRVLLDVRQRAWSEHPGFVQETLCRAVEGHGIAYRHRPALGVAWELRQQLQTTGDWNAFRTAYAAVLDGQTDLLQQMAVYARTHRMCLLCGERDPTRCHRSLLAERLAEIAGLTIEHIDVH